jgi:hypothetical protein
LAAGDMTADHKYAVLVGANQAAQGRGALKHAYEDAEQLAQVLLDTQTVKPEDLTLLKDPMPAEVLQALDARLAQAKAAGGASTLLFFYSGHADDVSLFPNGQPLAFTDLKARLDSDQATLRIGIIDACRGGGWTRAKGLTKEPAFEVQAPLVVSAEGSALIASSSGDENAHESDALRGSFFTHHLVSGLRGAADRSHDGVVTLQEAFEHAREMTIRDTAIYAPMPQHPSFDMRLHGRSDVALVTLTMGLSGLSLQQAKGPLQVIHLATGLMVVDLPAGPREARVALAPGKYLVRRYADEGTVAREVDIAAGQMVTVDEGGLVLVGRSELASKSEEPLRAVRSTVKGVEFAMEYGLEHGLRNDGGLRLGSTDSELAGDTYIAFGLTDRLQLNIPNQGLMLGYRFGDRGGRELIPYGGILALNPWYDSTVGFLVEMDLRFGADVRQWVRPNFSFLVGVSAGSRGVWWASGGEPLSTWQADVQGGFIWTLFETVTISVGALWEQNVSYLGHLARYGQGEGGMAIGIGSLLRVGSRPRPLVQVHLTSFFSIDGYADAIWRLSDGFLSDRFMAGVTFNF